MGATVEVRAAPPSDERLEAAESCFVGDLVGDCRGEGQLVRFAVTGRGEEVMIL